MIVPKKNTPKKAAGHTVTMSRMDYEIIKLVYEKSCSLEMGDEELSFLMGKRNKYFFELLDPTEKVKLKTEQLDVLPAILGLPITDLVPNDIGAEVVIIRSSKKITPARIVYRHVAIFEDGTESAEITWIKKLVKGERRQLNLGLHAAVLALVGSGYFDRFRNALEVYLELRRSGISFRAADLQKSFAVLMNKKRNESPVLECKILNARYVYRIRPMGEGKGSN